MFRKTNCDFKSKQYFLYFYPLNAKMFVLIKVKIYICKLYYFNIHNIMYKIQNTFRKNVNQFANYMCCKFNINLSLYQKLLKVIHCLQFVMTQIFFFNDQVTKLVQYIINNSGINNHDSTRPILLPLYMLINLYFQ